MASVSPKQMTSMTMDSIEEFAEDYNKALPLADIVTDSHDTQFADNLENAQVMRPDVDSFAQMQQVEGKIKEYQLYLSQIKLLGEVTEEDVEADAVDEALKL